MSFISPRSSSPGSHSLHGCARFLLPALFLGLPFALMSVVMADSIQMDRDAYVQSGDNRTGTFGQSDSGVLDIAGRDS
ncbi:MAG: hypothetical protein LBK99_10395, partial [Opitutaceae bacterium]|nr:hypothetical protein [Opitutaceae bacterium]